jgi:anti-anti-sigma factor
MDFTDGPVDAWTHVIEPHGEIDMASARELNAGLGAIMDSGAHYLIVDLEDVFYVDSAGIGVFLSTQRKLQASGGDLIVVCNDPVVRRVFESAGVVAALNVTGSRREALDRLRDFGAAG